jgi:hypothetical protein
MVRSKIYFGKFFLLLFIERYKIFMAKKNKYIEELDDELWIK